MQWHGCLLLLLCTLFAPGKTFPETTAVGPRTEIRVRLKRQMKSVEIDGLALQVTPFSGVQVIAYEAQIAKIRIGLKAPGVWVTHTKAGEVKNINSDQLIVRGQMLRLGLEPVPYELTLVENPSTGFDVIARLNLDDYIAGVLPAEMPLSWPLEALKAQAVAARSYVLRTMYERREAYYDVDSTIDDQVYKFLNDDSMSVESRAKLRKVLSQTRGEFLTDPEGRVLKAFYHADSGCQSEDPKFVWGSSGAFSSVKDPTCLQRKTYRWNLALATKDVQIKLKEYFALPGDWSFLSLRVVNHTPSGRVSMLSANFTTGNKKSLSYTLSAQKFRRIFGFQKVASSNFVISEVGQGFHLEGQGLGHGVGLSQWGARAQAAGGASYTEILKNFYPKAQFKSKSDI